MPLKCLRDNTQVLAFDYVDDATWQALKAENSTKRNLHMACCGSPVVAKTSKLGTRYFAHARRGECTTAPETAEHLLAKSIIAAAIRGASWDSLVEQPGSTPAGERWMADVMAVQGKKRIAFEVQWSRQDKDETERRQTRYAESGVRGLWLLRQSDFHVSKGTPSFRLIFNEEEKKLLVLLPSAQHRNLDFWPKEKDDPRYWEQTIELSEFVRGALTGRLRFAPSLGRTVLLRVLGVDSTCWRCRKTTTIVVGLKFSVSEVLPEHSDIDVEIYDFDVEDDPVGMEETLKAMLPATLLSRHNIGAIKRRSSKTAGGAYISNGCVHCDALQGRFYDHELGVDATERLSIPIVFDASWATRIGAHHGINRWWFASDYSQPA